MAGEKFEERKRFDGQEVKILMPSYAQGTDEDRYLWRKNIEYVNVGEEVHPVDQYLHTAERYFYTSPADWFGSEKRKNPA